jgi:hypothetical protein
MLSAICHLHPHLISPVNHTGDSFLPRIHRERAPTRPDQGPAGLPRLSGQRCSIRRPRRQRIVRGRHGPGQQWPDVPDPATAYLISNRCSYRKRGYASNWTNCFPDSSRVAASDLEPTALELADCRSQCISTGNIWPRPLDAEEACNCVHAL